MLQLSFKFKHGCELNRLSSEYPKITIAQWCNLRTELLEIEARDPELLAEIKKRLSRISRWSLGTLGTGPDGGNGTLMMTCFHRKGNTLDEKIEGHGCLLIHPVVYHGGWEHYRVIVLDENRLKRMITSLEREGRVEVVLKRGMNDGPIRKSFVISANELLAGLTRRQAEALLLAVEGGYYEVPRRATFEGIAKLRNTPRTTFEEHVRKAENKVIKSLAPYISFYIK